MGDTVAVTVDTPGGVLHPMGVPFGAPFLPGPVVTLTVLRGAVRPAAPLRPRVDRLGAPALLGPAVLGPFGPFSVLAGVVVELQPVTVGPFTSAAAAPAGVLAVPGFHLDLWCGPGAAGVPGPGAGFPFVAHTAGEAIDYLKTISSAPMPSEERPAEPSSLE